MDMFLEHVAEHLRILDTMRQCTSNDALVMMVWLRQHLENNNLKKEYPVTNFYCDWCLHVRLNRAQAEAVLRKIVAAIYLPGEPNDNINEALSLQILRNELITILRGAALSELICSSHSRWLSFVFAIVENVLDKPLTWSDTQKSPARIVKVELHRLGLQAHSALDSEFTSTFGITPHTIFWHIDLLKDPESPQRMSKASTFSVVGPLVLPERRSAFLLG